jgi:lysophospholipase L1-like esterase
VVVIGDSLSTGFGTSPDWAWPTLLENDTANQAHPLQIRNASLNGSGYVTGGDGNRTFADEVAEAVTPQANVVVFFGSENDMGADDGDLRQAATAAFARVRATAPKARIIVVGPPCYTDSPEPERLSVRDQDQAAAADAGATFIDPIREQWIVGQADVLIGPDGDHPTEAGQRYLEGKIGSILGAANAGNETGSAE